MEGALGFLVVRADDLVLLSVDAEGCVVEGRDLRAVDASAALVVTFPPQAITETKVVPASVEGAALAPVSLVTVPLAPGATIPLTVDGVLGAIAAQIDAASRADRVALRTRPRTRRGDARSLGPAAGVERSVRTLADVAASGGRAAGQPDRRRRHRRQHRVPPPVEEPSAARFWRPVPALT